MTKIIVFIASLIVFYSCKTNYFADDISNILGIDNVTIIQKTSIDEFGGFGEGYTIEIYELSENTIKLFLDKTPKNLSNKKNNTWKNKNWEITPIDNSYTEIYTLVLNYQGSKKLSVELRKIKEMLKKKKGIYYSFYYKPNKINPNKVQFFILDTFLNKLYAIDIVI